MFTMFTKHQNRGLKGWAYHTLSVLRREWFGEIYKDTSTVLDTRPGGGHL